MSWRSSHTLIRKSFESWHLLIYIDHVYNWWLLLVDMIYQCHTISECFLMFNSYLMLSLCNQYIINKLSAINWCIGYLILTSLVCIAIWLSGHISSSHNVAWSTLLLYVGPWTICLCHRWYWLIFDDSKHKSDFSHTPVSWTKYKSLLVAF
jgi:hypothetical protein